MDGMIKLRKQEDKVKPISVCVPRKLLIKIENNQNVVTIKKISKKLKQDDWNEFITNLKKETH